MDKKIAGLVGAVAGVAAIGSVQAAPNPSQAPQAASYADLLAPIPNAAAQLKAADAAQAKQAEGGLQLAQYYYYPYRYYHHHHHGVYFGPGGFWVR